MTLQEYFDKTVKHIRSLPRQAVSDIGTCLYRTEDGLACAVGVHIPDGHPACSAPGTVRDLIPVYPDLVGVVAPGGPCGLPLAYMLQTAHDDARNWDEGGFINHKALDNIGRAFDLDIGAVYVVD